MKWEYKIVALLSIASQESKNVRRIIGGAEALDDYLNRMGDNGWELVHILSPDEEYDVGVYQAIFKRLKKGGET